MKFETPTTPSFMRFVTMTELWFGVWFTSDWLHNYY